MRKAKHGKLVADVVVVDFVVFVVIVVAAATKINTLEITTGECEYKRKRKRMRMQEIKSLSYYIVVSGFCWTWSKI